MSIPDKSYIDAQDALKINVSDIVNDLTTGGAGVPLSAEMGKTLKSQITANAAPTHERGTVYNALTPQGNTYGIADKSDTSINAAGTGYLQNEAVFLKAATAGDIEAIIVITSVDTGGEVLDYEVSKEGDYTVDESGTLQAFGGSGTGFELTVTMTAEPASTLADIANPLPNDMATVMQDELHGGSAYRWGMMDYNGDGIYNWVPVAAFPAGTGAGRDFQTNPIVASELGTGAVTAVKLSNDAKALFISQTAEATSITKTDNESLAEYNSNAKPTELTFFPDVDQTLYLAQQYALTDIYLCVNDADAKTYSQAHSTTLVLFPDDGGEEDA